MDRSRHGPDAKDNKRQFLIRMDEGLIRRIKIFAIETHTSASDIVEQAIVAFFATGAGKPRNPDDRK